MKKGEILRLKGHIILGIILIGILLISGCTNQDSNDNNGQEKTSYIDLTAAEAKELIDNTTELIIIDVSPKYDEGHIPGAINYYVGDGSLDAAIPTLDKTLSIHTILNTASAPLHVISFIVFPS